MDDSPLRGLRRTRLSRLMRGIRFYPRVGVFPDLSVNFSTSAPSLSVGVRGANVTAGRRGIRKTVGIPTHFGPTRSIGRCYDKDRHRRAGSNLHRTVETS
ncbi:MAG: DUF4236 domain-containing protein [Candidatus Binataceae bacterium]